MCAQGSELLALQQKLKEAESVSENREREGGKVRADLEACRGRARELEARCTALERKEEELLRERDSLQEQHVVQVCVCLSVCLSVRRCSTESGGG